MAERSVRRAPLERGVEQAIVALKKGEYLLKCGKRGKTKFCPFRLSADEKALIWFSGEKEKQLKLSSVSKIVLGQKTVNFLRQPQPAKELQSFSLIYQNGERSLDLICKDKEHAKSWFLGLTALLSLSHHPRPLVNPRNGRGAHSCVSSPVGHVQRKYKLGLLEDSPKFLKVRSLYGSPPRSLMEKFFSDSAVDSSDIFYSSRQRTLSDMQPLLDEMLPHLTQVFSDSSKNMRDPDFIKLQRISLPSKINSFDYVSPIMDKTNAMKDVYMWGEGIGGLLGDGFDTCNPDHLTSDVLLPRLLQSTRMLEVHNISCGEKHAALITKQGELFCWGEESGGRLGHKMNMNVPCPKVVESLNSIGIQAVSCGSHHTCAVTSSGELYSWGDSSHGIRLAGDGNKKSQWFPHRIFGPLDGIIISKVACGQWHTAIVSSCGQLFTYGDGTFGVLGHGNLQSVSKPKEVESLKGLRVKCVACGPWHTAAVVEVVTGRFKNNTPGGKLFTWGDGDKGRLGHGDKETKLLPTCVASLVDCDFAQVACGRMLTVALTITGIVFTMGSAVHGQLGNPQAEGISIATVEGCLKSEFVKEISAGSFHVSVLTTKGKVYTWGKGDNGRLGLGDLKDRNSPCLVEALEDRHVQGVACGSSFTVAICLHESVFSKDQSACSKCRMVYGFTRKKHNCYNCGFVFCHACSNNKVTNASLAPNKSKRFRVCDPCFTQLQKIFDARTNDEMASPRQPVMSRKGFSNLKIKREEANFTQPKLSTPKVTREGPKGQIKLIEGKTLPMRERNRHLQDSFPHVSGRNQRWGQVSCPLPFSTHARENSPTVRPMSKEEIFYDSRVSSQDHTFGSKSMHHNATSLSQDTAEIDKIFIEEIQRLHAEAAILAQQCQSKSQKLQQYKHRIEETWALARDEAANCKAAKDVIKVLTNQMNAISEKFEGGNIMDVIRSMPDEVHVQTPRPAHRQLSDGLPPSGAQGKVKHQYDTVSLDDVLVEESYLSQRTLKASKDEWVEQDEPGVYITFIALPNGEKGLRRVRFSRKRFTDKEAERWWQENQSRVHLKYNIEKIITSNRNKLGN